MDLLELLLEALHSSLEMHFQPLASVYREQLHALRNISTLVNSANDVSERLSVSWAEIHSATGALK